MISRASSRMPALDALRGVAALMVVAEHAFLSDRTFWLTELQHRPPAGLSLATVLMFSPLHLLWSGGEAVFIFFVLSGLVLAMPWASGSRPAWSGYYVKRLVRLYLPIAGSVALAYAIVLAFPRHVVPGASGWLNDHALYTNLSTSWHEIFAVAPPDDLNSSIWSLKWEVIFSVLLPLYLAFGALLRRLWAPKILLCLGLILIGWQAGLQWLQDLPIFAIGTVLAFRHGELAGGGRRIADRRHGGWIFGGLAVLSVLLLVSDSNTLWIAERLPGQAGAWLLSGTRMLSVAGAALAVILCMTWRHAIRLGETRPLQWCGTRSFSIYLVHDPIMVTVALLLGGFANPAWLLLLVVPVVLVVAEGFYRLADKPSIRLARRAGASAAALAAARPQPRPAGTDSPGRMPPRSGSSPLSFETTAPARRRSGPVGQLIKSTEGK
jgi:peptidoglycan/LPS O-acetylase OafA/YrhL